MRSMETQALGDIRIDRIVEFEEPIFSPISFFDEATPEALAPHRHWLEPRALDPATGNFVMPVQSYLVRTRHHIVLIDTCIGCRKSYDGVDQWRGLTDESWLTKLALAGVQPEAVNYVFCTHFHLDHCGWNTRLTDGRWTPTFPNARYIFAREEYAAAEATANSVYDENVLPIMGPGRACSSTCTTHSTTRSGLNRRQATPRATSPSICHPTAGGGGGDVRRPHAHPAPGCGAGMESKFRLR
jgi:hypothetical protein